MTRVYQAAALVGFLLCGCTPSQKQPQRDADPAIANLRDQIAKDTTNWQLQVELAAQLRHKDRFAEAESAASKAFMLEPSPGNASRLEMAKIRAAADQPAAAINLVKEIEKKKDPAEKADEVDIAEVYAVLGDTAAVFRWLDRAVLAHSPQLATISTNPDLLGVQKDPRWPAIAGSKN